MNMFIPFRMKIKLHHDCFILNILNRVLDIYLSWLAIKERKRFKEIRRKLQKSIVVRALKNIEWGYFVKKRYFKYAYI